MLIVSYKRSFSITLSVLTEIENQELRIIDAQTADTDFEILQLQINQLNTTIGKSDLEPDKVQQKILSTITDYSLLSEIRLDQLQATHDFETVDFNIYSNLVSVKGTFNGLLSLIYDMENDFEEARITNITFYKVQNLINKKTELYASILFQHYRQKK
jgi:hypothetical protein